MEQFECQRPILEWEPFWYRWFRTTEQNHYFRSIIFVTSPLYHSIDVPLMQRKPSKGTKFFKTGGFQWVCLVNLASHQRETFSSRVKLPRLKVRAMIRHSSNILQWIQRPLPTKVLDPEWNYRGLKFGQWFAIQVTFYNEYNGRYPQRCWIPSEITEA